MLYKKIYEWMGVEQQLIYIGWGTLLIQPTHGNKVRPSKNKYKLEIIVKQPAIISINIKAGCF